MNLDLLRQRAELLDRLRAFFKQRGFLEVETPLVSDEAIPERHIELIGLADGERYLQASPEMHHKRLLCAGIGPLFEVTRSFRDGERGKHHHPEFTIFEWYRPGDDLLRAMDVTEEVMKEVAGAPKASRISYRDAFLREAGFDPHDAPIEVLRAAAEQAGAQPAGASEDDRDGLLNVVLGGVVEPRLGREGPELLYHYPASQSALAKTVTDELGVEVAERFEVYWRGVELANGYHELTDADDLRRRLTLVNEQREAQGAEALPLPEKLFAAMTCPGLPACAGVALGFDRLVMLATGAESMDEVVAFTELD